MGDSNRFVTLYQHVREHIGLHYGISATLPLPFTQDLAGIWAGGRTACVVGMEPFCIHCFGVWHKSKHEADESHTPAIFLILPFGEIGNGNGSSVIPCPISVEGST